MEELDRERQVLVEEQRALRLEADVAPLVVGDLAHPRGLVALGLAVLVLGAPFRPLGDVVEVEGGGPLGSREGGGGSGGGGGAGGGGAHGRGGSAWAGRVRESGALGKPPKRSKITESWGFVGRPGHSLWTQRGARFCANAAIPSAASSEAKSVAIFFSAKRYASSSGRRPTARTSCFASRTAFGPPLAIASISSCTAAESRSGGTTRCRRPYPSARAASNRSPVRNRRIVWCSPSLGTPTTEIIAGITPIRTSLKLNTAVSAAIAMSAAATSPTPPPNA